MRGQTPTVKSVTQSVAWFSLCICETEIVGKDYTLFYRENVCTSIFWADDRTEQDTFNYTHTHQSGLTTLCANTITPGSVWFKRVTQGESTV